MKDWSWLYFFTPFVLCLGIILLIVVVRCLVGLFQWINRSLKHQLQLWLLHDYSKPDYSKEWKDLSLLIRGLINAVDDYPKLSRQYTNIIKHLNLIENKQKKIDDAINMLRNKDIEVTHMEEKKVRTNKSKRKRNKKENINMLDSEEKELIKEAYQNGDSVKDISSDMDIEESIIYQYLFESGLL